MTVREERRRLKDRERAWREARAALDGAFSDRAMEREKAAWERYVEACVEAGTCQSPGCWNPTHGRVRCERCRRRYLADLLALGSPPSRSS